MAKKKAKTIKVWCPGGNLHDGYVDFKMRQGKWLRCPECNTRLLPKRDIWGCQDIGCIHLYIPTHKYRIKVKE